MLVKPVVAQKCSHANSNHFCEFTFFSFPFSRTRLFLILWTICRWAFFIISYIVCMTVHKFSPPNVSSPPSPSLFDHIRESGTLFKLFHLTLFCATFTHSFTSFESALSLSSHSTFCLPLGLNVCTTISIVRRVTWLSPSSHNMPKLV